jgi:hypothetical protein
MDDLPKLADLNDYLTGEHQEITVAQPTTKIEVEMVEDAYRRAVADERRRIIAYLEAETTYENLYVSLVKLKNIVNNKEGLSS